MMYMREEEILLIYDYLKHSKPRVWYKISLLKDGINLNKYKSVKNDWEKLIFFEDHCI